MAIFISPIPKDKQKNITRSAKQLAPWSRGPILKFVFLDDCSNPAYKNRQIAETANQAV
jgi:hypothetical protein